MLLVVLCVRAICVEITCQPLRGSVTARLRQVLGRCEAWNSRSGVGDYAALSHRNGAHRRTSSLKNPL